MNLVKAATNKARKTKLQGEIVLLDRDIKARQQKFGVDMFNLLDRLERDKTFGGVLQMPSFFNSNEKAIKVPYEQCRSEVVQLLNEKEAKELELIHIESARDRAPPAITANQQISKAGSRIADVGKESKLQVEIKLTERKIIKRKEQFGVDVFDLVIDVTKKSDAAESSAGAGASEPKKSTLSNPVTGVTKALGLGGVTKAVGKNIAKLSSNEKEIKSCIESAKRDVERIRQRKLLKQQEIADL